jgi:hypothetical protein
VVVLTPVEAGLWTHGRLLSLLFTSTHSGWKPTMSSSVVDAVADVAADGYPSRRYFPRDVVVRRPALVHGDGGSDLEAVGRKELIASAPVRTRRVKS